MHRAQSTTFSTGTARFFAMILRACRPQSNFLQPYRREMLLWEKSTLFFEKLACSRHSSINTRHQAALSEAKPFLMWLPQGTKYSKIHTGSLAQSRRERNLPSHTGPATTRADNLPFYRNLLPSRNLSFLWRFI